jgi:excisionase family DNA binding protein
VSKGLSATEAAVMAGVSREVMVRMIQSGQLKGWRIGRFWEVDAADLDRVLRERAGSIRTAGASHWACSDLGADLGGED